MTLCPRCNTEMRVATTTSFAARNLNLEAGDEIECPACGARMWNWGKVFTLLEELKREESVC